ncbi:4-alpha-glucanotransferase [Marinimicrobium alkaliphilum]|uniref:4-alpha-glucanotransferase n=1 Tax=Marinimicrobium alkaliphilum TaxID=2202654 RepID=UPI000DBAB36D|nr:4-alpha-glucanotransferase [Marinimicrobium alkaliphilum]
MIEVPASLSPLFTTRRAGVLLHPTSLPSAGECGNLGKEAYHFVNFLADVGLSVWQMLPVGPTHADLSPYQSLSSYAGNPRLICLDWLVEQGWFGAESIAGHTDENRGAIFVQLAEQFTREQVKEKSALGKRFETFVEDNAHWLEDFCLFQALRDHYRKDPWYRWPMPIRHREPEALTEAHKDLAQPLQRLRFEQFCFFAQWQALREYAHSKDVYFFGDIPIFVAHDSADVWANQGQFHLDDDGQPITVAGVPPDYFSETGQHWGNPHYRWDVMQDDGFQWWLGRIDAQLALYDLLRVDHFRGFDAYWSIPGGSEDARTGHWESAPGRALLDTLFEHASPLPIVAENLGVITPEVEALRLDYQLPGMRVLQFAFDGNPQNPHLPHNHEPLEVVYTGTHDNNTSLGWFEGLTSDERTFVRHYFGCANDEGHWLLIKAALASVAQLAIIPMQDVLGLGNEHRMNLPGTVDANWRWRFEWQQVPPELVPRLRELLHLYGRLTE